MCTLLTVEELGRCELRSPAILESDEQPASIQLNIQHILPLHDFQKMLGGSDDIAAIGIDTVFLYIGKSFGIIVQVNLAG